MRGDAIALQGSRATPAMIPQIPVCWGATVHSGRAFLGRLGPGRTSAVLAVASIIFWASRRASGRRRGWWLLQEGGCDGTGVCSTSRSSEALSAVGSEGAGSAQEPMSSLRMAQEPRSTGDGREKAVGVSASEWEQLSEEERRAWRELREQQKGESKARLERAMNASSAHEWAGVGLEMVFDLSYGASATDKMNRSLAKQLAYAYSYAKNTTDTEAPGMHITSYVAEARTALEKRGAGSWLMHKHPEPLREVFAQRLDDLIYLSPDGQQTLQELAPGKVYVIGGIVDRTVTKSVSLDEAAGRRRGDLPIPAFRLPIDEHIPRSFQGRGHVLNINTVAHILMAFKQRGGRGDKAWEEAIVEVMSARVPTLKSKP